MLLMMIRVLFLALICTAALPNEKEQPERPRLVVGIVVDQMRQDYLESYWKYFGENGFKRLKREGYVITNNHYNYFPTYTGPGHAAIYSGALPSVSGAVGNSWYDRDLKRTVYVVEELFGYLDKVVGKGNYLVFLTSDHGAADVPAERIDRGLPGGYFDSGAALDSLKHYLNSRYGKGSWVEAYINQQIYLNRDLIDKKGLALKKIQDETAGFIRRFEGVKSANTGYNYRHEEYTDGPEKMYQNGFMAARSGDVFILLYPGWLDRTSRTGTTHGSPYDYDTHVPLLFMGWGIPHGRDDSKTVITQIAPTLSKLLNIPFPDGTQAKVLNFD